MRPNDIRPGGIGGIPPTTPEQEPLPPALDRDMTVYKDGVPWKFVNGRLSVGGSDLNQLLNLPFHPSQGEADLSLWFGLADGLYDYRKKVLKLLRNTDQLSKFSAMVDAMLGKISSRLQKVYDQKMSGMSWFVDQDQLILNGINIRSFLALYRIKKTDKAKKFLKGLKGRLAVLLENRQGSQDYERVRDVVEKFYDEIDRELSAETTPPPLRYLPGPSGKA